MMTNGSRSMPYSSYFLRIDGQQHVQVAGQAVLAGAGHEVDLAALAKVRVDEPRIQIDAGPELARHVVVVTEMLGLAPLRPAQRHRRHHRLADAFQDGRPAAGKIVVQQHETGIEAGHADPVALAHDRLQAQAGARRQAHGLRFGEVRQQRADAHLVAGALQDAPQHGDVFQIKQVAGVAFRDQQHAAGARADALDGGLHGLHAQRQEALAKVVEAGREQVGVHRRQLEAGVSQVHRAVNGRRRGAKLLAKPGLDGDLRLQQLRLQAQQRPGQGGGQVRHRR